MRGASKTTIINFLDTGILVERIRNSDSLQGIRRDTMMGHDWSHSGPAAIGKGFNGPENNKA
jgi:hypothetical protein